MEKITLSPTIETVNGIKILMRPQPSIEVTQEQLQNELTLAQNVLTMTQAKIDDLTSQLALFN